MIDRARARFPADLLDLARSHVAVLVAIRFGHVIIIAALGRPIAVHLRVECPIGNVKSLDDVGQRGAPQLIGREPTICIPLANGVPHLRLADFHRQHAFRAERFLDFLVRHQRARTAKIATLPNASRLKNRNGLATLAFDGNAVGLPAALGIGNPAQRRDKIVFDNALAAGRGQFNLARRHCAAEGADQRLLGGVPLRFAAAGRAGEFLLGCGVRHYSSLHLITSS